jgi:hypothetical protein
MLRLTKKGNNYFPPVIKHCVEEEQTGRKERRAEEERRENIKWRSLRALLLTGESGCGGGAAETFMAEPINPKLRHL